MAVRIHVARETRADDRRVALTPDVAQRLQDAGAEVSIEAGAGAGAGFADQRYEGCAVTADGAAALAAAEVVLTVNPLAAERIPQLRRGAVLIGHLAPHAAAERTAALARQGVSAFALELLPRISRAQAMDALSSQAAVAGYKAALIAANLSGKFFPMLTTAAGTVRPSAALVIGAGVAGLQAIATARRLGAMTSGYDVRAEVKEQVESLGAKFVDVGIAARGSGGYARELSAAEAQRQQETLARHVAAADVIISTAAVPGRPAPRILSRAMVEAMAGGAVIVDLAAESGGNCELTQPGETIDHGGVLIHGAVNLPGQLPNHASELYARNLQSFLGLLLRDGELRIDLEDEIIAASLVSHDGAVRTARDGTPVGHGQGQGQGQATRPSQGESQVTGQDGAARSATAARQDEGEPS